MLRLTTVATGDGMDLTIRSAFLFLLSCYRRHCNALFALLVRRENEQKSEAVATGERPLCLPTNFCLGKGT